MNADAIQMICDRLGTTVNQLIPEVIKYTTRVNILGLIFGIFMFGLGIVLLIAAHRLYQKDSWGDLWVIFTITGAVTFFIGFIFTIIYIGELMAMNASPQIYAYKTIFGWIGGN